MVNKAGHEAAFWQALYTSTTSESLPAASLGQLGRKLVDGANTYNTQFRPDRQNDMRRKVGQKSKRGSIDDADLKTPVSDFSFDEDGIYPGSTNGGTDGGGAGAGDGNVGSTAGGTYSGFLPADNRNTMMAPF
eukprot:SAG11_NODE_14710_length_602_cov_1.328032_1_plen_132_part_10